MEDVVRAARFAAGVRLGLSDPSLDPTPCMEAAIAECPGLACLYSDSAARKSGNGLKDYVLECVVLDPALPSRSGVFSRACRACVRSLAVAALGDQRAQGDQEAQDVDEAEMMTYLFALAFGRADVEVVARLSIDRPWPPPVPAPVPPIPVMMLRTCKK